MKSPVGVSKLPAGAKFTLNKKVIKGINSNIFWMAYAASSPTYVAELTKNKCRTFFVYAAFCYEN